LGLLGQNKGKYKTSGGGGEVGGVAGDPSEQHKALLTQDDI
jgi:hypothetical protein